MIVALAVFAVPPLLANAYTGLRQIDPETREAAKGMGLSGGQLLRQVELPLSVPYLAAGLRTAAVQVVATAALAAFVNGGGLGEIISAGFGIGMSNGGGAQIVAGGIVGRAARVARGGDAGRRAAPGHPQGAADPAAAAADGGGTGWITVGHRSAKLSHPAGRPCREHHTGIGPSDCPSDTRRGQHGRAGTQKAAVCVETCS